MILLAKLPKIETTKEETQANKKGIFSYTYLWLGVIALFFYVGAEVIAIDTLGLYGQELGIDKSISSSLGTFSLIAMTIGYLLGIALVPKRISQSKALTLSALLGIIFTLLALISSGVVSVVFIILLSFANALIWPGIWPLALDKLGSHTAFASALLIMAIAGGAVMPLVYGYIADLIDNRQIPYFILIPIYLIIGYYSIWGYKIGSKK